MTVDTTVKAQTRTELRPGWRVVRFGDVVRNVDVNERNPREAGIERYVGLDHLDPESLHIKRWGLVEEGTTFTRKFTPGQVLFGKRRAYQRKAAVAAFDGICSGDILVFEPSNGELIPELLPFLVQSDGFFNHALGTSAGSLSPRTKWKDLAAYEFALPPRDEQRRIAEILWAADEAILKAKGVVQALGQYRSIFFETTIEQGLKNGWSQVAFGSLWKASPQSGYSAVPSTHETGHYVLALSALTPRGYQEGELKSVETWYLRQDEYGSSILDPNSLDAGRAS